MRKRAVVARIYGMKYSSKAIRTETDTRTKYKGVGKLGWRWARRGIEEMRMVRARRWVESNPTSNHTAPHLFHAKTMSGSHWCLPALTMQYLISSMPRQCQAVTDARGAHVHYWLWQFERTWIFMSAKWNVSHRFTRPFVEIVCELFGKLFSFLVILIEHHHLLDSISC